MLGGNWSHTLATVKTVFAFFAFCFCIDSGLAFWFGIFCISRISGSHRFTDETVKKDKIDNAIEHFQSFHSLPIFDEVFWVFDPYRSRWVGKMLWMTCWPRARAIVPNKKATGVLRNPSFPVLL